MSRQFNDEGYRPGFEDSSRNRRDQPYYNEPESNWRREQEPRYRQDDRQYQQSWRPFDNQQSYRQEAYGYRSNEPQDSYRGRHRYGDPGYGTPQDYADRGYRGYDRGWNQQRNYGNPYSREASYRPYESGYDAPFASMNREHYQPSSQWGNPERYAYRDDADYSRFSGNYQPFQGNYGSNRGSYNSQQWQSQQEPKYRGVGPRNYQRSDERILEDVNDRLNDNPYIDASDIQVDVKNGEVILEGTVESRWSKHHIEDIADSVSGVKDVENHIHIKRNIWEKDSKNADKQSADSKNKLAKTAN